MKNKTDNNNVELSESNDLYESFNGLNVLSNFFDKNDFDGLKKYFSENELKEIWKKIKC